MQASYLAEMITTLIGVGLFPVAIWMGYIALSYSKPTLILSGILSVIVGGILVGWARNPIWATRIRGEYALIKGVHPEVIEELPTWQGDPW